MHTPTATTIGFSLFIPFMFWRAYARYKRSVGKQRLSKYRAPLTLLLYSTILYLLFDSVPIPTHQILWMGLAWLSGACLAWVGLRLTQFEATPSGLFYTPNTPLGLALSFIFVLRILYRLYEVFWIQSAEASINAFVFSTLTLAVFSLLAGYYMSYALGLGHWRYRVFKAKRLREIKAGVKS